MKLEKIFEEKTALLVPAGSKDDPFHKNAFYNPRMSFNRSMASVAMGALLELGIGTDEKQANTVKKGVDSSKKKTLAKTTLKPQPFTVLDAMAGTGARGLRYACDNKGTLVTFVEPNPDAVKLLKANIKANKLKKTKIMGKTFHALLSEKEYYDFIELDPFGTPVFYLEGASMLVKKGGLVSATGTDLAKLAGNEPSTCLRNYCAKPMKCSFCHEIALRILIKRVIELFAVRDFVATPLFSFYQGHAIKTIVKCEKDAVGATQAVKDFAFANLCHSCGSRWISQFPQKCSCGGQTEYAGPLYSGKLNDENVLKKAVEVNEKRNYSTYRDLDKALNLMIEENELPPLFYDCHELSKLWKMHSPKTEQVIRVLREKGFAASGTHFEPTGFRTSASIKDIKAAFKALEKH